MPQLLFKNFELLEPSFGELHGGYQLLVEGETIRELSDKPIKAAEADIVDCGGRTLMPGLIDCHVHAIHSEVNVRFMEMLPLTLVTARAATRLRAMLDRGFTTVRDTGGADWGIKTAIETGHITGPRLYIAGQSIGPTGGHSDSRRRTNPGGECVCCNGLQFKSAIADGVDEVRKCAREQMRQGADHVKIMMSGGVASPYDPLDSMQFSDGEVSAAVEEATAFGRYVCAHASSAESISRAARLGVRTIEHGNLIDDASAKAMAEKGGMFLVANLVTYYAMKDRAAKFGMIGESLAKNEIVLQGGLKSLEICKRHGIPVAYGSDLLGELHWDQSKEFTIRQEVVSPIEIIRSATTIGADVLRLPGKLGTLQAGAFADAILVDGNPLKDLALLGDQGKHLPLIMKAGILHKNRLN
jgi:imidazolonepropionase-like amidohydrolase